MARLKPKLIGPWRPATRADIEATAEQKSYQAQRVTTRMRDSHHRAALLWAAGCTNAEVQRRMTWSANHTSLMRQNPAMEELIAQKRSKRERVMTEDVAIADEEYIHSKLRARNLAQRMIEDRLEKADEDSLELPFKDLIAVTADADDRVGVAKRNAQVNITAFADQIEDAIRRSNKVVAIPTESNVVVLPPPLTTRRI